MKALTLFALALTLLSLTPTFGQTKSIVGFYNVENLFDTLDTEGKNDIEFLPGADRKWNTQKYQEKITHINTVIENSITTTRIRSFARTNKNWRWMMQ